MFFIKVPYLISTGLMVVYNLSQILLPFILNLIVKWFFDPKREIGGILLYILYYFLLYLLKIFFLGY